MLPDHLWIAQRIPHQNDMCLIDHVTGWSERSIECMAINHRNPNHPLAHEGELSVVCGIEYAAQAMAIHGALLATPDTPPRQGYLASARNVRWTTDRLDTLKGSLIISAHCLSSESEATLYQFVVQCQQREILSGRASIFFSR